MIKHQQQGSLCAQHCLNALLQGPYFSATDLAALGQQLDETERECMAEQGVHSSEYASFLQSESSNYDDSGYFSIQVISAALKVWNLDYIRYNSQDSYATGIRSDPTSAVAFICNLQNHWFCIRKLGYQWFNLNSLLSGPVLISDTYLSLFLAQLLNEGYSIFIVIGELPPCDANEILKIEPAVQKTPPSSTASRTSSTVSKQSTSKQTHFSGIQMSDLQNALTQSKDASHQLSESPSSSSSVLRHGSSYPGRNSPLINDDALTEEKLIQMAIEQSLLSLDTSQSPSESK